MDARKCDAELKQLWESAWQGYVLTNEKVNRVHNPTEEISLEQSAHNAEKNNSDSFSGTLVD